jgi:UDP-N-acetylmuramyl pentapeptide phosphotransferase/UDP-N-acetylglucosamine-1-phosphate transferase
MLILIISFITSFVAQFFIIRYAHLHAPSSLDFDFLGIQKFHNTAVPRIGGFGIFISLIISLYSYVFTHFDSSIFGFYLLLCSIPVVVAGFAEDLTKKVSARIRLLAALFSSILAVYVFNTWLLIGSSYLGQYPEYFFNVILICITCFCVAGVSHSFNLIDGYHGLSAMVGVIILFGIAYVAFLVSDFVIVTASFCIIGAILGFLPWNFPRGLIFLGDGGAYLIGFWIAQLSVLLTARNPEVSIFFPCLLSFYPIFETLFTIYRRAYLRRVSPGVPDASHLHQLVHCRIIKFSFFSHSNDRYLNANAATSPFMWIFCSISVIPAVLLWSQPVYLFICIIFYSIIYICLYRSIAKFSTPKWLIW